MRFNFWLKGVGGKFCRNVARVRVLRESTGWGGVVLEMSPSHNLMVKAELEAVLKGRKEVLYLEQGFYYINTSDLC